MCVQIYGFLSKPPNILGNNYIFYGEYLVKSEKSSNFAPAFRKNAILSHRGVEQLVARQAHNLEVACSSPASATHRRTLRRSFFVTCGPRPCSRSQFFQSLRFVKAAKPSASPASATTEARDFFSGFVRYAPSELFTCSRSQFFQSLRFVKAAKPSDKYG